MGSFREGGEGAISSIIFYCREIKLSPLPREFHVPIEYSLAQWWFFSSGWYEDPPTIHTKWSKEDSLSLSLSKMVTASEVDISFEIIQSCRGWGSRRRRRRILLQN